MKKLDRHDFYFLIIILAIAIFCNIAVRRAEINPHRWIVDTETAEVTCPGCLAVWDLTHVYYDINYCPRCGLRLEGVTHERD